MKEESRNTYDRVLHDARRLLHEDELNEARATIESLKGACLENPHLLYPPESFKPRFVVWELTLRCNMRCRHCGSDAGTRRGHELDSREALELCDSLASLGCERLTLLGGEPFIREDWEQLALRLRERGVRVNVITNGWLTADADMVRRIRDAGLTTFAVSVDGYGSRHDDLRRKEGSFDRIVKSFRLAAAQGGLTLAAVTTVTKLSINDLETIYRFLIDEGVRLWQLQVCTPQGRLERGDPVLLDHDELRRLSDFIVEKKQEKKLRIDPADNVGYYGKWELLYGYRSTQWGRVNFWNGCQAGCQVLGVDANGDIKGCLSLPSIPRFIEGNIREEPLETIWRKPGAFAYNREFSLDMLSGTCKTCEYRGLCRAGCVSHAFCSSGERGNNPDCLHRFELEGE